MSNPDNLTKAKAQLIINQPFFASLVLGLPMIKCSSIPTLATDGDRIFYNPKFLEDKTLPEIIWALAHETLHCVFMHMYRRGDKDKMKYNIAADYIINDLLEIEKIGSRIKGTLYDPALVKEGNNTTEGVYRLLPDSAKDKQPGDAGGSFDEVMDGGQDEASIAQKEAEMRVKVVQAANAAKMAGKFSGNLERMVKSFTRSRTDWRAVLRRFLTERAKTELSYARPKRRFLAEDIYLPSLTGEKLGEIVVAVDCSGSVGEEELKSFSGEIQAICEDAHPAKVNVVYFDSEVLRQDTFEDGQEVDIKPVGGGGTAFSPIFKYISENQILPAACVVLTDLQCSDFGEMPDYPVLWASTDQDKAPWGEIVMIKE
jgi:predicted metal-dependent peptidase